jgi:hypothetical protein
MMQVMSAVPEFKKLQRRCASLNPIQTRQYEAITFLLGFFLRSRVLTAVGTIHRHMPTHTEIDFLKEFKEKANNIHLSEALLDCMQLTLKTLMDARLFYHKEESAIATKLLLGIVDNDKEESTCKFREPIVVDGRVTTTFLNLLNLFDSNP